MEDQLKPQLSDTSPLQNKNIRVVIGGGGHSVVITGKKQFVLKIYVMSEIHFQSCVYLSMWSASKVKEVFWRPLVVK